MTRERTIADLVEDVAELSLVADAMRDASWQTRLDLGHLEGLLAPLAARNGCARGDGAALLRRLMQIAGLDIESLSRSARVSPGKSPRSSRRTRLIYRGWSATTTASSTRSPTRSARR